MPELNRPEKARIGLVLPYFGKWPEWFDLFLYSAARNPIIHFIFYTDCPIPDAKYPNITFYACSFNDYVTKAQQAIGVPVNIPNAIKTCDLRPMFGLIHSADFEPYEYYGWCDIDIILGNIAPFVKEPMDSGFEVFATHADRISGHFAFFKNNLRNKLMYHKIYKWKEALLNPDFVGIDEHGITNAYVLTITDKINQKFSLNINNFFTKYLSGLRKRKLWLHEQYTTPFLPKPWLDGSLNSAQPELWYYQNNRIWNSRDGNREFMYLHLMNFKGAHWRHDGTPAPWQGKPSIYFVKEINSQTKIEISPEGISVK